MARTETTFTESREKPIPVIEETDPLGLESAEDGLGLAGLPEWKHHGHQVDGRRNLGSADIPALACRLL